VTVPKFAEGKSMFVFGEFNKKLILLTSDTNLLTKPYRKGIILL
jgi:hypothetical protein